MEIRLQKFIADCGVTSRRKAEELILQGRVKVNDKTTTELGSKVNPAFDVVEVDDRVLDQNAVEKLYILLNKPRGYMTTVYDPEGRPTVMDLVKEANERIYPVGRLDYLSEGAILLTNDGQIANYIAHPSFNITKVYEVKVFGAIRPDLLKRLREGAVVDGVRVRPLSVQVIKQLPQKTWLEFRLGEGRNREIRSICETHQVTVEKLKRISIEGLSIQGVASGKYVYLSKKQVLDRLGMNENGQRDETKAQKSRKRFHPKKKKGVPRKKLERKGQAEVYHADDERYIKFRKEHYYGTINSRKEKKPPVDDNFGNR